MVATWVEGTSLLVIPAFILFRFLPHLYLESGVAMLVLAGVGYVTLSLIPHGHEGTKHHPVVLPALAAHALLDGATLVLALSAARTMEETLPLTAALLLHRIPEGLFIVAMYAGDVRKALPRIAIIGLATAVGALGGDALFQLLPRRVLDGFVAFGLGMMLRIMWKQGHAVLKHVRTTRTRAATKKDLEHPASYPGSD